MLASTMPMFLIHCLAWTIIFSHTYALPADPVANSTAALPSHEAIQPLASARSRYHCNSRILSGNYVNPMFCQLSINKLPSSSIPGDFHTGAPDNVYQLPREGLIIDHENNDRWTYCMVRVKIRQSAGAGAVERATWSEIESEARSLTRYCTINEQGTLGLTGWTTVGENERIKVRLVQVGPDGTLEEDDEEKVGDE